MWNHEYQDWPNFTWSVEKIAEKLINVRNQQGFLLGRMQNIGFELKQEANLKNFG